ncbi:MAG: AAA family ATPase, partial [Lachnospiraceae bacterium]|nr:AAA family ATPase [Lachnospiraceae bacterium]
MGIYLNPNNENFRSMVSAEIYVDKTMMISITNDFIDKGNKYICMSRPRRFGKTITGNMLSAYYSRGCDSSGLFKDYKISSSPGYEDKRNKYNVIKIDMNSEYQNTKDKDRLIDILSEKIIREICEDYPDFRISPDENTIAEAILEVYSKTNETFIIIIDEYDVLVREQVSQDLFDRYLSFLNGLFKSDTLRPAISLAYLTGILP